MRTGLLRKYYRDNRESFPSGSYRGLWPAYYLYNIISKIEADGKKSLLLLVPNSEADRSGSRILAITPDSRAVTLVGLLTENPPPRYRRPTLSHYPPPLFSPGSTPSFPSSGLRPFRIISPFTGSHLEDIPMATTVAQSNSPFTETSPANQREIRSPIPWEAGSPSRPTIVSLQLAVKIIRPGYRSNSLHQYVSAG